MSQTKFFPWNYMCTEGIIQLEVKKEESGQFLKGNKAWSHWWRPNGSARIVEKSKLQVALRKYSLNFFLLRHPARTT